MSIEEDKKVCCCGHCSNRKFCEKISKP